LLGVLLPALQVIFTEKYCGFGVNLVEIASSTFEGSATGAAVELIIGIPPKADL